MTSLPYRIGYGFDIHRLETGRPLVIGGERISHDRGPAGHSDGDVVLHALTDAILGALGGPDIGALFPDTDARWAAADSAVFVREACRRMGDAGLAVGNVDLAVLLQRPTIGPHKEAIRRGVAERLGCEPERISVKGKTHERVDSIGEERAIACHAVVLLAAV